MEYLKQILIDATGYNLICVCPCATEPTLDCWNWVTEVLVHTICNLRFSYSIIAKWQLVGNKVSFVTSCLDSSNALNNETLIEYHQGYDKPLKKNHCKYEHKAWPLRAKSMRVCERESLQPWERESFRVQSLLTFTLLCYSVPYLFIFMFSWIRSSKKLIQKTWLKPPNSGWGFQRKKKKTWFLVKMEKSHPWTMELKHVPDSVYM